MRLLYPFHDTRGPGPVEPRHAPLFPSFLQVGFELLLFGDRICLAGYGNGDCSTRRSAVEQEKTMIRKLRSGEYRLYSRKINPSSGKRRNLGTFNTRAAAEKHEREVQYFKRH
jgi:hypothetical protein